MLLFKYEVQEMINKLSLYEKSAKTPQFTAFLCGLAAFWLEQALKAYEKGV